MKCPGKQGVVSNSTDGELQTAEDGDDEGRPFFVGDQGFEVFDGIDEIGVIPSSTAYAMIVHVKLAGLGEPFLKLLALGGGKAFVGADQEDEVVGLEGGGV